MRILVTGANGQVGHELLRALAEYSITSSGPVGARRREAPASSFRATEGAGPSRDFVGARLRATGVAGPSRLSVEARARAAPDSACCPTEPPGAPGRAQARSYKERHGEVSDIIPATRTGQLENGASCERIDLADLDGLNRSLDRIAPDLIINAAAYTAVDRAEDEPAIAQRINGNAPGAIGAWAARHGARVVHYSTDYVFDGRATRPYREDDATRPLGAYGRTKLAGEIALRASDARHLVFRTAWVYAARGHNFLLTMLKLGSERDTLRVVDDQIGAPTPAGLIADITAQAVVRWCDDGAAIADGVYHLVAAGQTSWCGFARAIFARAHRAGLLARAPGVQAIGTAEYPTKATRPAWSVLDTAKLRAAFGIALPDWEAALDGVMAELHRG